MNIGLTSRIPWTERFRPKSLDEVILTKNQRETIENWWRHWVIWWNLRLIWFEKYGLKWLDFVKTDDGKKWSKNFLTKWKDSFRKNFENVVKSKGLTTFFVTIGKKNKLTTELKKGIEKDLEEILNILWEKFIKSNKKAELEEKIIPPFPPYKPILLIGPPGTGKTSSIYALAWQEGVVVVEFNASDKRNSTVIRTVVNEATKNVGFTDIKGYRSPPRIILLDEVDGLNPREDRGGFSSLLRLIDETRFPIAFTANVMHDRKVRTLMVYCTTVFFNRPADYQIEKLIKMISVKINTTFPQEIVNVLKKYAPDFRTVVSALETYYYTRRLPSIFHNEMYSLQDAIRLAFSLKVMDDGKIDVFKTVGRIQEVLSNVEGFDPHDMILWAWENASSFVPIENIFPFYDMLARADYLYKLGSLKGNWRIAYRDSSNLLAIGMAKYGKPVSNIWALRKIKINKPTIIEELGKIKLLMMGSSSASEEVTARQLGLGPLLEKYAQLTHISRKEAWYEMKFLSYLGSINPELLGKLFALLYLPEDTVKIFLNHFMKKVSSETKEKLLSSYREYLGSIGPKVVSLRGMETEEIHPREKEERKKENGKAKEEEVAEHEEEKEEKKKKRRRKKEEKKGEIKTLDEFFS